MFIKHESVEEGFVLRGEDESMTQMASTRLIQQSGCQLPTHEFRHVVRAVYCIDMDGHVYCLCIDYRILN
jgi:hypothetical protein